MVSAIGYRTVDYTQYAHGGIVPITSFDRHVYNSQYIPTCRQLSRRIPDQLLLTVF
jgi:hypothetical protein